MVISNLTDGILGISGIIAGCFFFAWAVRAVYETMLLLKDLIQNKEIKKARFRIYNPFFIFDTFKHDNKPEDKSSLILKAVYWLGIYFWVVYYWERKA